LKRVLFLWVVPTALRERLRSKLPELALEFPEDDSPEVLRARAPEADAMVGWRYDEALLDAATSCTICVNPGAGVQHLRKLWRGREAPPLLCNGHGNARLTAEGAVALLLTLAKQVAWHDRAMRRGEWVRHGDHDRHPSVGLTGKRLGLLGYGAVNRNVGALLGGFEMDLHVHRRSGAQVPGATMHTSVGALMEASDVVVVAVPRTPETEGIVGAEELRLLGASGLLVNVARGPVVQEAALHDALSSGVLAGAAIDVWYEYAPEPDEAGFSHPATRRFDELDNVVLSPHRAASPFTDLERWDDVVGTLRAWAAGETPSNVVDLDRGY